MDSDETKRIARYAKALKVERPIVDGRLRLEKGRCVFLGEDQLCRLHSEFGMEVKPKVCRQFPMIAIRAEEGVRVGVDPACYTANQSWLSGPPVAASALIATRVDLAPGQENIEAHLLQLCEAEGVTVAGLLSILCAGEPAGEGDLPAGLAGRIITKLKDANLGEFLEMEGVSPALRQSVAPVLGALETWDVENPPDWPALEPQDEAWAIEAIRTVLFLRLCARVPTVAGVALLMLMGVVVCGWTSTNSETFGRCLAGWTRGLRFKDFWTRIVAESSDLTWLARGSGNP